MSDCTDGFCALPTARETKAPAIDLSAQDTGAGISDNTDIFRPVSAEEAGREGSGSVAGDSGDRDLGGARLLQQQGG
ncbi:hypothetical protein VZG28_04755 [Synechococcus elongatus IITB4]|uniref:hypothetical protein n=1 Tax=Synechococcus elongatus TaxID=32046 RepID=UPI0030CB6B29